MARDGDEETLSSKGEEVDGGTITGTITTTTTFSGARMTEEICGKENTNISLPVRGHGSTRQ